MKVNFLTRARELWNVPYISRAENRANQRKWIRGIRMVGDKWLLAHHAERLK